MHVCLSMMDPVCVCVSVCDGPCVCVCVCVCIMIPVCTCLQSRDKARVSSMVVTAGDACAYVADQRGFVHVYDIEEYGLQGQELQPPTSRHELST